jgi:hypothetical protein
LDQAIVVAKLAQVQATFEGLEGAAGLFNSYRQM